LGSNLDRLNTNKAKNNMAKYKYQSPDGNIFTVASDTVDEANRIAQKMQTGATLYNSAVNSNIQQTDSNSVKADNIKSEMAEIQAKIDAAQRVIQQTKDIGLNPNDPIPGEFLTSEPLLKDLAPVPENVGTALGDVVTGTSGAENYYKLLTEQLQKDITTKEKISEEKENVFSKVKDFFTNKPDYSQIEEQARTQFLERYGLPKNWEAKQMQEYLGIQSEIVELRNKYNNIEVREQQALSTAEQRLAPNTFIRGEQALIQRQFALEKVAVSMELSSKAAEGELYSGNVEMADRYIKDYISAATYDTSQKKEELSFFMDYYSDQYNSLDTNIQNTIKDILLYTEKQEILEKTELEQKWSYITDAAQKGVNLNLSGAEIKNMSVDDVAGLYTEKVSSIQAENRGIEAPITKEVGGSLYQWNSSTGQWELAIEKGSDISLFDDIMMDAISNGANPNEAVLVVQSIADERGVNLNVENLQSLAQRAEKMKTTFDEREEPEEPEEEIGQIEKDIANLKSNGNFFDSDTRYAFIRYALRQQGYTDEEITKSSVGSIINKAGSAVTDFFSQLFK
jgi:hypothetical protein